MLPQLRIQFSGANEGDRHIALDFEALQALVRRSQSLQQHLAALTMPPNDGAEFDQQHHISEAVTEATAVDNFVSQLWSTFPPQYRLSDGSATKAQEVFGIPELLENILSHLTAQDLLVAQQTSIAFRDMIDGSLILDEILALTPDRKAHFYSPFEVNEASVKRFRAQPDLFLKPRYREHRVSFDDTVDMFRGLYLYANRSSDPKRDINNTLYITVQVDHMRLHLGARCLRMLICQPPVKRATVALLETKPRMRLPTSSRRRPRPLKARGQGITVGDLLKDCGDRDKTSEDKTPGRDEPRFFSEVEMEVELDDDDPIMHERRAAHEEYWRSRK
ncbi:hypothetical protein CKM354_001049400 [Cercospora kikuchii]|uniref:F-box domain-containing protein n=1 Tax=Cercospora kikuchii TaxID=84275 RepID=A0A9P3FJR9_9PEZI|nr:uncharacterized protein CKM354_001049400 [Cercospora kikuchii]GIZ47402.1 hypothetical protein CKM354_001049400 [Cercospora kikuchii]